MIASFEDVDVRFHRDLDSEDRPLIEARLWDMEVKIRNKIPDLDYRITQEPYLEDTVKSVCAAGVIRLITNPDGYVQETDGGYTYMRQQLSNDDGRLTITREEWADLGIRKKIMVIHAAPVRGTRGATADSGW